MARLLSYALHRVDPVLKLGGRQERARLIDLSLHVVRARPFPPCGITWSDLYREPELSIGILKIWSSVGYKVIAEAIIFRGRFTHTYGTH
jgi:hypothetical protein